MINFTPWRIRQRQQSQRRFFICAGWSAGCGIFIVAMMAFSWHQQTRNLQQETSQLMAEQAKLQPQVTQVTFTKQAIIKHQRAQQITRQQRQQQHHYHQTLLWLAAHWPATAQLNAINFSNQTYQLYGLANTTYALTELIQQLKRLPYVKRIEDSDWQMSKTMQGQFTVRVQLMESEHVQTFS
ncbi:MAG: hypothetical protein GKR77_04300 [Legionellales bacterium]|nr:hypothetical protein [Legionellales bacterium]